MNRVSKYTAKHRFEKEKPSMKCVGIIAEYNPFHNGHAYHIDEAKRASGADAAVVVMSGSFVQRGEPACMNKFVRRRDAVLGGADMVIELPDLLSCACAERFALGGIRLLSSTGIVDSIAFGSESGDMTAITSAAEAELSGDALKELISKGYSYPKAVSLFLAAKGIDPPGPNDLLGLEYVRAVKSIAPQLNTIAVKRIGSDHSSEMLEGMFASAGAVRKAWIKGRFDEIRPFIPGYEYEAISSGSVLPAVPDKLSSPVLYALRSLGKDGIRALPEVSEGLENPIYEAALRSSDLNELLEAVKTKRYTMARLKRIMMSALLGSTEELQKRAASEPDGLYIRVLGVRAEKASELLSMLCAKASLPVIAAAKDVSQLSGTAKEVFEHACRAQRILPLACPERRGASADFPEQIIVS